MLTEAGGNLLADLAGYFLGAPSAAPFGAPANALAPACSTPTVGPATAPVGPIVFGSSRRVGCQPAEPAHRARLLEPGVPTGAYGLTTVQAVMAFQKWKGLPATTVVDNATASTLNTEYCRPAGGRTSGTVFEVDKTKQIAYVIQNGQVRYIFNVSTGNGKSYDEEDRRRQVGA